MKKVFVVSLTKESAHVLAALRDLGVVHLEHERIPQGTHIDKLKDEVNTLSKTISLLGAESKNHRDIVFDQSPLEDWLGQANEFINLVNRIDQVKAEMTKRQVPIDAWEKWGDFDNLAIQLLAEKGIFIQLFEAGENEIKNLPKGAVCEIVARAGKLLRFVVISREKINLPFNPVPLPQMSLGQMEERQRQDKGFLEKAVIRIKETCRYLKSFEKILAERISQLKFEEAMAGMGKDATIVYLKGFCPAEKTLLLETTAQKEKWAVLIEDPSADDRVPTLLHNPKWVELVKPVFSMMNIIPGYKELDISLIFLFFFSVFFGILIGDAGYGFVFLGLTLFAHTKLKGKVEESTPFILIYVLSSCAIVWGLLTGTFFGTVLISKTLKPLVAWLTENKNVQFLCFLIGATHLTIAHGWRLLMRIKTIFSALAELGWIVIIWGAFFLANTMIIGAPLWGLDMNKSLGLVGAGAVLVITDILSRPKDGPVVGLVLTFFGCISAFTDVVSYIRLFAVGLAGVAVADAFNEMALSIGFNHIVTGFLTVAILMIGHLFNIILGSMAIFVHGLRLNVLEFSSHLGMEWSGIKYEPFRK